jgi:hypothetical protein
METSCQVGFWTVAFQNEGFQIGSGWIALVRSRHALNSSNADLYLQSDGQLQLPQNAEVQSIGYIRVSMFVPLCVQLYNHHQYVKI